MEIVTGSGDRQYDLREAQMRKKRSIEILKAHNVPYTPHRQLRRLMQSG